MRIALFSDIHANLPALEAMFADMDARKPDAVYCLGDLVGYNIWPNEVIQRIRERGIPTIAGNYDFGVGRHSDECGCAYKSTEEKEMGHVSISFTNEIIKDEERQYLRTLPTQIRVECATSEGPLSLLLVHGSPRRNNEYLFEDRDERSLLRMMREANAHVMCFGHTHKPYHRVIQDGAEYRHAINTGSVGKPKDGDPRGCYVLLTLSETARLSANESIHVEFLRFAYDVEQAAQAVEKSRLPNAYAAMLREAR